MVPKKRFPRLGEFRLNGEVIDLSPDAIIINGPPDAVTRFRGPGYEYPQIIGDVEMASKLLLKQTADLSKLVSKCNNQGDVSAHYAEIDQLFQYTFTSASKSIFLLHQLRQSLDYSINVSNTTNVTDSTIADAVASAAAFAAAQSSALPALTPSDMEGQKPLSVTEQVGV